MNFQEHFRQRKWRHWIRVRRRNKGGPRMWSHTLWSILVYRRTGFNYSTGSELSNVLKSSWISADISGNIQYFRRVELKAANWFDSKTCRLIFIEDHVARSFNKLNEFYFVLFLISLKVALRKFLPNCPFRLKIFKGLTVQILNQPRI